MDPLSHLSFIACFIFLYEKKYLYFAVALLIGILAKESVAVLALFFIWRNRSDPRLRLYGIILLALACSFIVLIRMWIQGGSFGYLQISQTDPDWFFTNLRNPLWESQVALSFCIFLPFLLLQWKSVNSYLRELILFLAPILLLTNLFFSNLTETRNLIPVVIPLLIVTAKFLREEALETKAS